MLTTELLTLIGSIVVGALGWYLNYIKTKEELESKKRAFIKEERAEIDKEWDKIRLYLEDNLNKTREQLEVTKVERDKLRNELEKTNQQVRALRQQLLKLNQRVTDYEKSNSNEEN